MTDKEISEFISNPSFDDIPPASEMIEYLETFNNEMIQKCKQMIANGISKLKSSNDSAIINCYISKKMQYKLQQKGYRIENNTNNELGHCNTITMPKYSY